MAWIHLFIPSVKGEERGGACLSPQFHNGKHIQNNFKMIHHEFDLWELLRCLAATEEKIILMHKVLVFVPVNGESGSVAKCHIYISQMSKYGAN